MRGVAVGVGAGNVHPGKDFFERHWPDDRFQFRDSGDTRERIRFKLRERVVDQLNAREQFWIASSSQDGSEYRACLIIGKPASEKTTHRQPEFVSRLLVSVVEWRM